MISQFSFILRSALALFIIAKLESNVKDEDFKYSPPTKDANIRKFSLGSSAPIVRSQFNDAYIFF